MTFRSSGRQPRDAPASPVAGVAALAFALLMTGCAATGDSGTRGDSGAGSSTWASGPQASSTLPAETTAANPSAAAPGSTPPTASAEETASPAGVVRTVSGDLSGNRTAPGRGNLPRARPVDVPLAGTPRWVVGADTESGVTWVAALDDGRLQGWLLEEGRPVSVPLGIARLPAGMPPIVMVGPAGVTVIEPPADASPHTFPVPLPGGGLIYVTQDGAVVAQKDDGSHRFEIDALPDARITVGRSGLAAVPAEATDRYPHGALGDPLEAGRVVIIDPEAGAIVAEAVMPESAVMEGMAALWADIDGDGRDDIVVTMSDREGGARLTAFDQQGDLVASGPAIGRANRWRNPLGVAALGPGGEKEIVDVRVPHIGGVVEFFRLEDRRLTLVAEQSGFTSHVFGSRNLDMALLADADGDGRIEVVLPTQEMTALGLLRRTAQGVTVSAQVELPGILTTNLAAVTDGNGLASYAAGSRDGVLRIWSADAAG